MRTTVRTAAAAVFLAVLSTACGASGEPAAAPSTPKGSAPPRDKGPVCDGSKSPAGVHVLRGGAAEIPGGGKVTYREARADGSSRSAVLAQGAETWTVTPGEQISVGGHAYTAAQICTYRVVLTSKSPTLSPSPTNQGTDMSKWPTTTDDRWRLRWHVPDNGPDRQGAVVTDIQGDPERGSISVVGAQGPVAWYQDVRQEDTVEIAGRLWRVSGIDTGNMDADTDSPDFKAGYVDLKLIGDA